MGPFLSAKMIWGINFVLTGLQHSQPLPSPEISLRRDILLLLIPCYASVQSTLYSVMDLLKSFGEEISRVMDSSQIQEKSDKGEENQSFSSVDEV